MIQDENSTHYFRTIDEAYHISLKVEEKLNRETQQKGRGRGFRGRGKEGTTRGSEKEEESTSGRGGNSVGRGRGSLRRGKGKYVITFLLLWS